MEKLGVRPGSRVSVLGVRDDWFVPELERHGADVSARRRKESDLIFIAVDDVGGLSAIGDLEPSLLRNGAVWVVYPKGRKDLKETDVISAGLGAGLVDNKIVRFSDTHTALRFVIPLARR